MCRSSLTLASFLAMGVVAFGGLRDDARAADAGAARPLPVASRVPVGREDVVALGSGAGVDRQATLATRRSGGFVLVYARFQDGDLDSAQLRQVVSETGDALSDPRPLSFGHGVEDAPAFIDVGGRTWLYFASRETDTGSIGLWRSRLDEGTFAPAHRLDAIEGLTRLVQWPRWVAAGSDALLTFRGLTSVPTWLRLEDGLKPGPAMVPAAVGVAYPRVVPLGNRGCFFSYQRPPEGGYMATYYRVSADCARWSDAAPLAPPPPPNKPDVHDAYALPRPDGGVDVYYVYPSFKGPDARFAVGFDLYRRSVRPDGRLGPEQRLTDRTAFNPFAPSAHRLQDGTVLVSFSDILENGADGVSRAQLTVFRLKDDAAPVAP
ncbi:Hypothetical protein I596_1236 [Dokdonella koreensis DS-123]|uniref:Uncharacterized protein n=2 Tax=Dokdonella TaxID=323413 RepID=A0A167GRD4_9GAMM|nr:Hypothetical protein I596_1236 [Dokdonella koreensis DS-123]